MDGVFLLAAMGAWCVACFALLSITAAIVGVSRWLSTEKRKGAKTVEKAVDNAAAWQSIVELYEWD